VSRCTTAISRITPRNVNGGTYIVDTSHPVAQIRLLDALAYRLKALLNQSETPYRLTDYYQEHRQLTLLVLERCALLKLPDYRYTSMCGALSTVDTFAVAPAMRSIYVQGSVPPSGTSRLRGGSCSLGRRGYGYIDVRDARL
jgi:hypothetical protein